MYLEAEIIPLARYFFSIYLCTEEFFTPEQLNHEHHLLSVRHLILYFTETKMEMYDAQQHLHPHFQCQVTQKHKKHHNTYTIHS